MKLAERHSHSFDYPCKELTGEFYSYIYEPNNFQPKQTKTFSLCSGEFYYQCRSVSKSLLLQVGQ